MPPRRCRHFDQDTGKPLGSGCPTYPGHCRFAHPDSSRWREAHPSRQVKMHPFSPRGRSESPSSGDSSRNYPSSRMPRSSGRYGSREPRESPRELGSRITEPSSLGSRLEGKLPPSSPRGPLSRRIQDVPPPRPHASETLSDRISEPPPASSWTAPTGPSGWGSSFAKTDSSWGAPAEKSNWEKPPVVHASWPQRQSPLNPSTSSHERSRSSTAEPIMRQKDRQPTIPLPASSTTPTLDTQPFRPVEQLQLRPAPPPSQLPPPLPPNQLFPTHRQQTPISVPVLTSPVQEDSSLTVSTALASSTQARPSEAESSRLSDQHPSEAMENRRPSLNTKTDMDQIKDVCETSMHYMEYYKAQQSLHRVHNQRSSFKYHRINEGAISKIDSRSKEAETVAKEKQAKFEDVLLKVSHHWPSVTLKDSRQEEANRQLQALQQHVQSLEDMQGVEDASPDNSLTIEQLLTRGIEFSERLEQVEEYQGDVENQIQQRLDDMTQKHRQSYDELFSETLFDAKESAALAELFQQQLAQLAQKHEAFANQSAEVYRRQTDMLRELQSLREENENLKKRLAIYQEQDTRLHSQLQAVVQSLDILKQESSSVQGRTDQLTESMKTIIMAQTREHIEKRFNDAQQDIGLHLKTSNEVFSAELKRKYGPAINLLEQVSNHVRNAGNQRDHDATLN